MSIDYIVYTKDISQVSIKDFENYALTLGISVEVHPEFDLFSHSGFLPFKLKGDFIDSTMSNKYFLSGFELFLEKYTYSLPQYKLSFFDKIFKKNPSQVLTNFDKAIMDSLYRLLINCSSQDSFEILLAYIYSAYLCKFFSCVLDDPQTGQFFSDVKHIENEIYAIIDELRTEFQNNQMLFHEFENWI